MATKSKKESSAKQEIKSIGSRPRRFFFHYHKQLSKKNECTVLSVHWRKACHMVNNITLHGVPFMETYSQAKQPHCIVRGFANSISFETGPRLKNGLLSTVAHVYYYPKEGNKSISKHNK